MLPMLEDHRETDFSKAMHVPLGLSSPLWLPFAAATGAGLAFWWMTRWTRSANLEAAMEAMAPQTVLPAVAEPAAPAAEPVFEAAETMTDAAKQIVEAAAGTMETVAAPAGETVETAVEAVTEPAEPAIPPAPKKKSKPAPEAPLH